MTPNEPILFEEQEESSIQTYQVCFLDERNKPLWLIHNCNGELSENWEDKPASWKDLPWLEKVITNLKAACFQIQYPVKLHVMGTEWGVSDETFPHICLILKCTEREVVSGTSMVMSKTTQYTYEIVKSIDWTATT